MFILKGSKKVICITGRKLLEGQKVTTGKTESPTNITIAMVINAGHRAILTQAYALILPMLYNMIR